VIRTIDGVPFARNASSDFRFFIQLSTGSSAQAEQERYVWQLANILFNDDIEDDISAGVPPRLREKFLHRIKKDRLSRLWENIVRQKHGQDLDNIASPEERALALLTSHRIEDACKVLVESGNLHLATLLAQIGRDRTIRLDMQKQVESWRQHNVFSEMNEPIRALYELLAGNALRSEGRPSGAVEDRATTFTISERFELDWFQAFGLRLWYGVTDDEPIEAAVSQFLRDLTTGDEPAYPFLPHLEASSEDLRHNQDARSRESPLWVLLKVYAATTGSADLKVGFPAAILPESVSGCQLSSRLSFQLHQMITTTVGHNDSFVVDRVRADQLTWDYAWELIGSGLLEPALFVLLHLSSAVDRERSIKEALGYFAISLPRPLMADGTPDPGWRYLANEIQLPESWIWVAKALYARYIGDNVHEVGCLVRAKNWNEAHATFCRVVGPRAIIERDYQNLHQLLVAFGDAPDRKIRGWTSGGAVYADFLLLVTAKGGRRDTATLKRLVESLAVMGEKSKQTSGAEGLDERVAFMEMSRVVASWCVREDTVSSNTVSRNDIFC
jgi:nuclear pore complex protein Nup98-Nup96